jgi:phosphoribosyl-AMP cyclohydrolase
MFSDRGDIKEIEQGEAFAPKFENGVIPCVAVDAESKEVLMFAFMNEESLSLTLETGLAHYWSRSRKSLWKKGESSGMTQRVVQLRTDCDQDCLVMEVELAEPTAGGEKASCHVGYKSCFYREVLPPTTSGESAKLKFVQEKVFDPDQVYGSKGE